MRADRHVPRALHRDQSVKAAIAVAAWLLTTSAALALYLAWVHQPFI